VFAGGDRISGLSVYENADSVVAQQQKRGWAIIDFIHHPFLLEAIP
jgi:hypothetical protein